MPRKNKIVFMTSERALCSCKTTQNGIYGTYRVGYHLFDNQRTNKEVT